MNRTVIHFDFGFVLIICLLKLRPNLAVFEKDCEMTKQKL